MTLKRASFGLLDFLNAHFWKRFTLRLEIVIKVRHLHGEPVGLAAAWSGIGLKRRWSKDQSGDQGLYMLDWGDWNGTREKGKKWKVAVPEQ